MHILERDVPAEGVFHMVQILEIYFKFEMIIKFLGILFTAVTQNSKVLSSEN